MLKSYIYLRSSVRYYAYINTYEWVCFADQLHPAIFLVLVIEMKPLLMLFETRSKRNPLTERVRCNKT